MKHISRKFLNHLSDDQLSEIRKKYQSDEIKRVKEGVKINKRKITPKTVVYLTTTKGVNILGFPCKVQGHTYTFPEPNPTLIYFASAQRFRREIEKIKPIMLPKLNLASKNEDDFTHDVYNYYGAVCGTIIFLSTALESFMNSLIEPKDVFKTKDMGDSLNFIQIQKTLRFDDKIKKAIPELREKDFFKDYSAKARLIAEMQEFRDNIIHTKTNDSLVKHDYLIKKSFSFKYDETIQAVADYMNYYKPNSISECTCGADF